MKRKAKKSTVRLTWDTKEAASQIKEYPNIYLNTLEIITPNKH